MTTAKPTINEAFAARRRDLLELRHQTFQSRSVHDFAPWNGFCEYLDIRLGAPCRYDLVAHYAEDYPTADITRCPKCSSSYCD